MDTKIVHLHLKEPNEGITDLYFSSIKAIYDVVPRTTLGIRYESLLNALNDKTEYRNKKIVIRIGKLIRKANVRTKGKEF